MMKKLQVCFQFLLNTNPHLVDLSTYPKNVFKMVWNLPLRKKDMEELIHMLLSFVTQDF